tara:strand:+ start:343 stop:1581 length:1239 start_codon:yes stop_codon:yes gene_type:complete
MINRIKQWDLKNFNVSDRSIMSLTFVVALMALIIAIPGGTNCASADTCTVSSTANFTGNVALKSNTNYSATLQHSLAANVIANFEDPGYAHTGSIILRDSSGDLNLVDGSGNGGLGLGNSATSTNGFLRWTGSEVQVYNSGWAAVGSADQNVFTTISGNTGNLTASTTTTSIKLEADSATGLTVVAAGDKLEIQSAGGGGSFTPNIASYNLDSSLGFTSNPNNYAPQTNPIYLGYNGTTTVMSEIYDIGNCWSTTVGQDPQNSASATMFVYDTNCGAYPYKISYIIQMYDSGQTMTNQQTSKVIAQLYYQEDSSTRHSIKYGDNTVMGYYQYSSSYLSGFNNHFSDEAVVCFGYDTDNSYNNRFFIKVFSQNQSHIKGDTAQYKMTTVSMERLNLGSLNTCDNTVSPYPSMN